MQSVTVNIMAIRFDLKKCKLGAAFLILLELY